MIEPVYEFVKGQGWTAIDHERFIAVDRGGYKFWVIKRRPKIGDRYIFATHYQSVEHLQNHIACFDYLDQTPWSESKEILFSPNHDIRTLELYDD